VDGQTFADIEQYGLERWLGALAEELRVKAYRPSPVRRVWIPKPDRKQRPLGIPTIKDRVVQTAALLVLEPIFEADLQPEQYAYRANRSALDAVNHVRDLLTALKLTVNETKTHVREVPAETFDFLGYTFGLHWTHRTKRKILCGAPSKKRVARVCERISAITDRKREPSPRAGCWKTASPVR